MAEKKMAAGSGIYQPTAVNLDSPSRRSCQPVGDQQFVQGILERTNRLSFGQTLPVQEQPGGGESPVNTEPLVRLAAQDRRGEVKDKASIFLVECPYRT